jgi:hypothetical protein
MNAALARVPGTHVALEYAEVVSEEGESFSVKTPFGVFAASRAAGCLIAPETGDLVLCAADAACSRFILTVLSRAGGGPARLDAGGHLEIGRAGQDVRVLGRNVSVSAGESMTAVSGQARLCAARAEAEFETLTLRGGLLDACLGRAKALAGAAETVIGRIVSRARRVYRRVDEFEDARFGRLRMESRESMDLDSRRARLTAREAVDVLAEKINLG